jgi:hypothetical protein
VLGVVVVGDEGVTTAATAFVAVSAEGATFVPHAARATRQTIMEAAYMRLNTRLNNS